MKISIGNDHAGPSYKNVIVKFLKEAGHTVSNYGTDTPDSVDYPDFGHPVATDVEEGKADFGIVICGSGNGIAMTVNKHQGVRAALCWITSEMQALEMVKAFITTEFEGGRHQRRVDKIACN